MPWASRSEGRTAMSSSAGDGADVVAAAGEHDPVADRRRQRSGLRAQRLAPASPRPRSPARSPGAAARTDGIAAIRWRCPFSASSRATTPISGVLARDAVSRRAASRAATGTSKRDRSTPLGMTVNAAAAAALGRHLGQDRLGRHDQSVHRRRQRGQRGHVLRRADARRVDGGHHDRRPGGQGGARADHLGAVHVGVDEVDLLAAQLCRQLADGGLVIGLIQDLDLQAQPAQALHGTAR